MINYKVLLVEDDFIDRKAIERFLKDYDNEYIFYFASSFKEALRLLKDNRIDVIVSDYQLGDGDAMQLMALYKDIPLIIITGAEDVELAVTSMKAGAFDFLVKDKERAYLQMIPITCAYAIKRKEQESMLNKMVQAVEQSPTLIIITNKEGLIEYINPKVTEQTGFTFEEIKYKSPKIFNSGHQSSEFYKNFWDILNRGEKWNGEFYNKNKDGTYYWESASIAPIKNSAGDTTHFVKVGEDISQKKKAEELNIYSEKLKSILEIAGTVSHELNQPLQIIMGHCELLSEKAKQNPWLEKSISSILSNIERIVEIINKIRTITEYKTRKYADGTDIIDLQ
ncbi:MAG: PAS domain S-box protein [Candidatus Cloacimonadales bacterium]|jgi:PAS domain S-box-containing protein|nr:PAS domain S-box protein [Candidatus Cloacimonadota bacterium]MDD2649510.1 PAS domain S-box protein [Candidatus Cloacimonadota bacterium]MDD3501451.1 PAS domain S-box protein [Candidatus Cloacimonadota bacterium]MDX9977554.1 PAS domain S-box protein [Candidatus Cloacimonadales bacterium]